MSDNHFDFKATSHPANLTELADHFDACAKDSRQHMSPTGRNFSDNRLRGRAEAYESAARIVRNTILTNKGEVQLK